jgi:hypothetical protein
MLLPTIMLLRMQHQAAQQPYFSYKSSLKIATAPQAAILSASSSMWQEHNMQCTYLDHRHQQGCQLSALLSKLQGLLQHHVTDWCSGAVGV